MEDATRSECLFELSDDFGHLLNVQSFSDINIKCGGITIPSHKSILSARSSVFATMIHNKQMREGIEHEMDIFDTDISVLKIMLLHMYTGKLAIRLFLRHWMSWLPQISTSCLA
ncbi:hypothetical protein TNCT_608751 [Trichonephila clavata]|uniref:BTB domain-containing protein n=1 Tax=Trichonephila clavata TaxID=2740835 RepID=A0A8X6FZQ4_TRICU|nr:hypothetical protein TNCT_608751 [Trichonephila clavata]